MFSPKSQKASPSLQAMSHSIRCNNQNVLWQFARFSDYAVSKCNHTPPIWVLKNVDPRKLTRYRIASITWFHSGETDSIPIPKHQAHSSTESGVKESESEQGHKQDPQLPHTELQRGAQNWFLRSITCELNWVCKSDGSVLSNNPCWVIIPQPFGNQNRQPNDGSSGPPHNCCQIPTYRISGTRGSSPVIHNASSLPGDKSTMSKLASASAN